MASTADPAGPHSIGHIVASHFSLNRLVVSVCLYLSLVRATNIGLFYPANEFNLAAIDYTPQTMMNYVLLLGIIGYLVLVNDYSFAKKIMSQYLPVILLGGVFISLALSTDKPQSVKFVAAVIAVSVPSLLYLKVYGTERLIEALGKFALAMAFVNLIYLIAFPQYAIMTGNHAGKWKGMFEHKNFSGPFFAIAFFLILHTLNFRRAWLLFVQATGMLIALAFVYYAQSSTALVAFVAMGFVYCAMLVIYRLDSFKDRITVILIVFSLLLAIFAVGGQAIGDAFFAATGKDSTLTGRTGIWHVVLALVAKRPFIGFGPGLSERPDFMQQIHGAVGWDAKSTHNSYLDLLISFGYPETILIVLSLARIWFASLSDKIERLDILRSYALAASLMLVVFIVAFASGSAMVSRSIFWLFMVIGSAILFTRAKPGGEDKQPVLAVGN